MQDYFVYWPFGAARSGLDIEVGFLLEQMDREKPEIEGEHVTVFYEDDGATRRAAGFRIGADGRMQFASLERTRRTHYYSDLVDLGGIAKDWENHGELVEEVLARANAGD
ncbi:MAG: hypothetical protein L3K03_08520 [Thermoplasmata archaeon]|nr:hypothetical protein [Thermoplasmata archaeon]